jgi:hypothetical protein
MIVEIFGDLDSAHFFIHAGLTSTKKVVVFRTWKVFISICVSLCNYVCIEILTHYEEHGPEATGTTGTYSVRKVSLFFSLFFDFEMIHSLRQNLDLLVSIGSY